MQNKKEIIAVLKAIAEHNEKQLEIVDGDQGAAENLYIFECEGVSVYNPFYDTTLRLEVDPIAYYGEEVILSFVERYKKHFV